MELRSYVSVLIRWGWLIVLLAGLGAGVSYVVVRRTPPIYEANATVLVNLASSPASGMTYNDIMTADRLMKTYAEWFTKRPVLEQVIHKLRLSDTVDDLADRVSIQPVRDTQMLVVTVDDVSPQQAAAIANQLPIVFVDQYQALRSQRLAATEDGLTKALTEAKAEVDKTQSILDGLGGRTSAEPGATVQDTSIAARTTDPSQISQLQGVLSQQQETYAGLLKNYQDVRVAQAQPENTINVIEPAVAPLQPIKPKTTVSVLLGAIVGIMVGFALIVLLNVLWPRSASRVPIS